MSIQMKRIDTHLRDKIPKLEENLSPKRKKQRRVKVVSLLEASDDDVYISLPIPTDQDMFGTRSQRRSRFFAKIQQKALVSKEGTCRK